MQAPAKLRPATIVAEATPRKRVLRPVSPPSQPTPRRSTRSQTAAAAAAKSFTVFQESLAPPTGTKKPRTQKSTRAAGESPTPRSVEPPASQDKLTEVDTGPANSKQDNISIQQEIDGQPEADTAEIPFADDLIQLSNRILELERQVNVQNLIIQHHRSASQLLSDKATRQQAEWKELEQKLLGEIDELREQLRAQQSVVQLTQTPLHPCVKEQLETTPVESCSSSTPLPTRSSLQPVRQLTFAAADTTDDWEEARGGEQRTALDQENEELKEEIAEITETLQQYEEDYVVIRAALEILNQKFDEFRDISEAKLEDAQFEKEKLREDHERELVRWNELTQESVNTVANKLMGALQQAVNAKNELKAENERLRSLLTFFPE